MFGPVLEGSTAQTIGTVTFTDLAADKTIGPLTGVEIIGVPWK
jgi:hypothetical protein